MLLSQLQMHKITTVRVPVPRAALACPSPAPARKAAAKWKAPVQSVEPRMSKVPVRKTETQSRLKSTAKLANIKANPLKVRKINASPRKERMSKRARPPRSSGMSVMSRALRIATRMKISRYRAKIAPTGMLKSTALKVAEMQRQRSAKAESMHMSA